MRQSNLHDLLERSIERPDGRRLTWVEHGDPTGTPILYCHGTPGCGAEAVVLAKAADEHGVRLVAVNRPGFAGSQFQPNRTILDWPADCVAVADELGVDQAAVLGYSGGGPYALACAAVHPDRFPLVGVAAGAGPYQGRASLARMSPSDRRLTRLSRRAPALGRVALRGFALGASIAPGISIRGWKTELPEADQRVLDNAEIPARDAMFFFVDAMRSGARGALHDYLLLSQPWGFDVGQIEATVRWWHGLEDRTVPVIETRAVTSRLPHVTVTLVPHTGHLLLTSLAGEIVASLASG